MVFIVVKYLKKEFLVIVTGSETEYGITAKSSDKQEPVKASGHLYEFGISAKVVREVKNLGIRFTGRKLIGIKDQAEHKILDDFSSRLESIEDLEDIYDQIPKSISRDAYHQRTGASGFFLQNGARFYVDLGHPEYSTPETSDPMHAVIVQKAGDAIVEICRRMAENRNPGLKIRIDKNNSDGKGNSYASHENYCLDTQTFEAIIGKLAPGWQISRGRSHIGGNLSGIVMNFLVTRQVILGAGKIGFEYGQQGGLYQISQRADFIQAEINNQTTEFRPIINTRNIPYASFGKYSRLHIICGDSNMSELSLFLKFGITALFFDMIKEGFIQKIESDTIASLKNPVRSFHKVSKDLTLSEPLDLMNGRAVSALDLQKQFCSIAKDYVKTRGLDSIWQDVVNKWEGVLDGLSGDRFSHPLSSQLDWVLKERLINHYLERKHASFDVLKNIDIQYHNIDSRTGIYYKLLERGDLDRIISSFDVNRHIINPPNGARAWFRGEIIRRYSDSIMRCTWNHVSFKDNHNFNVVFIRNPMLARTPELEKIFEGNPSVLVFIDRLKDLIRKNEVDGIVVNS